MEQTAIEKKFPGVLKHFNLTPDGFAKKVFDYRRMNGYTLRDLGDIIGGVGPQTVMRWERMLSFPRSRPMIKRLIDLNII